MADEKLEATNVIEGNLPDVVASLEMLSVTVDPCTISSSPTFPASTISSTVTVQRPGRMELRKRFRKCPDEEVRNRRCSLRPKKRTCSEMEMESEDDIKSYYLDRSIKKKANNLETIFEEPDDQSEDVPARMSAKRFKRMIQFQSQASDAKIKKRRVKVKRIFGTKVILKHRHSMQTLISKMKNIESESIEPTTKETTYEISAVYNPYDAVRHCNAIRP